jgi:pepF/M3 family oligoendopeptidase
MGMCLRVLWKARKDLLMSNVETIGKLPHWDLDNIYPGLESESFQQAVRELATRCDDLDHFLTEHRIAQTPLNSTAVPDVANVTTAIEGYLERMNASMRVYNTIRLYVRCIIDTDSSNNLALHKFSELEPYNVRIRHQTTLFQIWLGKQSTLLPVVISKSPIAQAHSLYLRETAEQSRYLMSEAEESLAAELAQSGIHAWSKLHGTVWSHLNVLFGRDGKIELLPMPLIQNLAMLDPDANIRQRAAEAEMTAWASMREPLTAALNGVKGATTVLNKRRGRTDALHAALDQARIDRATLDIILSVIQDSLPSFRRFLKAKAVALGKQALPWWDVSAPIGQVDRLFTFSEAQTFITIQFDRFSPRLGNFATRAFEQNWIDAEPRAGKQGNAYCSSVPGTDIARILCNFDGSLVQVFAIAHELGHGFHRLCQIGKTIQQWQTPVTLAESASLFCETLVTEQALADAASPQVELAILNTFLGTALTNVVDTTQAFFFEKEVFERREKAELSADELCEISQRCQAAFYGDGLDPNHLHPYAWTALPHYFLPNISFYNFPYSFGLLFSLGLYTQYQQRGITFIPEFETLLATTGEVSPSDLAARFGINLRKRAFWQTSLDLIEKYIRRFQHLCAVPLNGLSHPTLN